MPASVERASPAAVPTEPVLVSLPWLLAVLLRHRRAVLAGALAGVLVAVLIAAVRPRLYTATFSFLPQTSLEQPGGGLASLAGQFGFPVAMLGGPSLPPQFYADLLTAREVLAPIAAGSVALGADEGEKVPVAEFLEVDESEPRVRHERTLQELRDGGIISASAGRTTGVVTAQVRTGSPRASLQIAEQLLHGLNTYNMTTRQSQAAAERRFTEGRLEEARRSLRAAEDALQSFLEGNRQFGSPQLTFERERREREVLLQQQVVTGLAQQNEDARIREVRNTPVITLIEQPALPVLPDSRGRGWLIVLGAVTGTLLAATLVVLRAGWRRQRVSADGDPSYELLAREWRSFRSGFRRKP
jgi:uncharacterized protein involved in exopolysaccharide biosynthesis